jgi:hypothetical protein
MVTEIQKQKESPFADFPRDTGAADSKFVKSADSIVRINVAGRVWLMLGSEIAHYGHIKFNRLPALSSGLSECSVAVFARTAANNQRH